VSHQPALLIGFDGKPVFAPIAGTTLTYAVNTNWVIVHDPASALYYVHAKSGWYSAADPQDRSRRLSRRQALRPFPQPVRGVTCK